MMKSSESQTFYFWLFEMLGIRGNKDWWDLNVINFLVWLFYEMEWLTKTKPIFFKKAKLLMRMVKLQRQ